MDRKWLDLFCPSECSSIGRANWVSRIESGLNLLTYFSLPIHGVPQVYPLHCCTVFWYSATFFLSGQCTICWGYTSALSSFPPGKVLMCGYVEVYMHFQLVHMSIYIDVCICMISYIFVIYIYILLGGLSILWFQVWSLALVLVMGFSLLGFAWHFSLNSCYFSLLSSSL